MRLIPTPKSYTAKEGVVSLDGAIIAVHPKCDPRIFKAAQRLCNKLNTVSQSNCRTSLALEGDVFISHGDGEGDAYTLTASASGIVITADSASGAFYGIQTLLEMVTLSDSAEIECCRIDDTPDFPVRGFYHDMTRGRVPTLDTLKTLVDRMAMYKYNQFQMYVEDSFMFKELIGVMNDDEVLTADEIIELDDYCYDRFIEMVPSVASFGHLYSQLQCEGYKHLCEYKDYEPKQHYWLEKAAHHTVDPLDGRSFEMVCSRIGQFAALCRSDKFNICCDETFDLCKGKNTGKDAGELYFDFVLKLLCHMKELGKRSMMWGDIVLEYPDKLSLLPKDTIMLNWCYTAVPKEEDVKTFAASGMPQYVCPSTNSWARYIEETSISDSNITLMAKYGSENNAEGILVTNWGDYGDVCMHGAERYGFVLGGERAWNASEEKLGAEWARSFAKLTFFPERALDDCPDMVDVIFRASECQDGARWMEFVPWFSAKYIEDRDIPFPETDEAKCRGNIERIAAIIDELRNIPDKNANMRDLIIACEAVLMMNRLFLHFAGFESECVDNAEWLDRYCAQWLERNKYAQLYRIRDFLTSVFTK